MPPAKPQWSVERTAPDALYLVEPDGTRWRVHDAHFTNFRPHRTLLGSPDANTRYFVNQGGEKRAYSFVRDERRDASLETLVHHFQNAGFIIDIPFDPRELSPNKWRRTDYRRPIP